MLKALIRFLRIEPSDVNPFQQLIWPELVQ